MSAEMPSTAVWQQHRPWMGTGDPGDVGLGEHIPGERHIQTVLRESVDGAAPGGFAPEGGGGSGRA